MRENVNLRLPLTGFLSEHEIKFKSLANVSITNM